MSNDPRFTPRGMEGKRYRTKEDGAIYLCIGLQMRHVANFDIYSAMFRDNEYQELEKDWLDTCQFKGLPLNFYPPLVRNDSDGKIYLIDQGKARWIKSGDVFNFYHFKSESVKEIGAVANLIPQGDSIGK